MLSFRFGQARPFAGYRQYDNGAGGTMQVGITTYSETEGGDENYQTTYLEWGGRSDHLDDAINNLTGREVEKRSVKDCSESERRYVASVERNTKDEKSSEKDAKAAPAAA